MLEAAKRSALLRNERRVKGIDLDNPAEPVRLVRLLAEIKALVELAPAIGGAADADALIVRRLRMVLGQFAPEVAVEVLLALSHVPQGVTPPAQLLTIPRTRRRRIARGTFRRSCPAAGPVMSIAVSAVMRRVYLLSFTTCQGPFGWRRTSTTEPPCAAISMSTSSLVILAKSASLASCTPTPGNISSSLVYSWFATIRP